MESMDYSEKVAQEFIDKVAGFSELTMNDAKVHRFTPSIRHGRRYLVVEQGDYVINVEVNVEFKPLPAQP